MQEKLQGNKIGQKVRYLRELKKITREQMASKLKISLPGYSKIERDEVDLTIDRANQIANILGITLNELISFDEKYIFNNYAHNQNAFVINSELHGENKKQTDELIAYLKSQLQQKDELIATLMKKLK